MRNQTTVVLNSFLLLLSLVVSLQGGLAQQSTIAKKAKKNTKNFLNKKKLKSAAKNAVEEVSDPIIEGRRIDVFDYNALTDNIDVSNPGGSPSEKEDINLPDNTIFIDTLDFIRRSTSIKTRDKLLYQKGLPSPITNVRIYEEGKDFDLDRIVFGWHPHWMKNAYESYNFSLLSILSYYAYELNPKDGSYVSIHDWENTDLVQRAHRDSCKVLLSVSNIGAENNRIFLSNRAAQRQCISTLIRLIQQQEADGIHIDFEGVAEAQKDAFTNFILDMGFQLKAVLPEALLTLSLPLLDFDRVYQPGQLNSQVDLFVMTSGEFYGSNTTTAGPIASMNGGEYWWQFGLARAVDEYLAAGIRPEKLLLSVPYYGAEWITNELTFPSKSKQFYRYMMYRDIKNAPNLSKRPVEEPSSQSVYIGFQDKNNNYHQIWYEDTASLAKKYAWVQEKELGGVAIWALGYDNGHTMLWQTLDEQFSKKAPKTKARNAGWWRTLFLRVMRIASNPQAVLRNPRSLLSLFGFLTGTSLMGFFMLYRYGHRFSRAFNIGIRGVVFLVLLSLLGLIIYLASTGTSNTPLMATAYILGGFVLGAIVFLLLYRSGGGSEKDLP